MNILKLTIPASALMVTALMAGTAIANNYADANTVEEAIVNETVTHIEPLAQNEALKSYDMASGEGEASECEDDDEDEGGENYDASEKEEGEDEDDGDEYANAKCGDENMTTQG